jgi:Skp family chaperone for outer membrane proteins
MRIQTAAPGAATADYARELRARAALKQAEEARRAEVSADAAKVRSSPRFEASETRKAQARAKLQQVREWLKIVRKLYAENPKAMARALAQAFKELKAAVQSFKDAGGQDMGSSGDAVGAVLRSTAKDKTEDLKADKAATADAGDDGAVAAGDAPGDAGPDSGEDKAAPRADPAPEAEAVRAAFEGRSLYDAVVSEVRRQLGEDGLAFLKEVREMVRDIGRLLETAKGQAAIRRPDKDTEKAFEETDEARKELDALMADMEGEIRRDAPTAGMRLSIAA